MHWDYIVFLAIINIWGFVSCENKNRSSERNHISYELDTLYKHSDTIVIAESINKTGAVIKWGVHNKFFNSSQDTIPYQGVESLTLIKEKQYFLLKSSCGTACNFAYIIKFFPSEEGQLFMYPVLIDLEKNLIVYKGNSNDYFLIAYNLNSDIKLEIQEDFDRTIHPFTWSVDSISLTEAQDLFIQWENSEGQKNSREFDLREIFK